MVKRGSKSRHAGSAVDQLQAALTRSLKESVAETVSSVCESFQHIVEEQTSTEEGDYDVYYNNCRRLVDYIEQHMEASPGFAEQMDRIILACHSGATERVLNSVVTKELWLHRRGDSLPQHEMRSSRKSRSSSSGRFTKKKAKKELSAPSRSSSRVASRTTTESPAMHTRSALGGKRPTRGNAYDAQPVKRPRRAARKVIQDSSEEEEEEVKPVRGKKEQVEEDDDELLSFKDAIGELCYPDRRTPSETKFFKERLRKSIQFVDALLCKPPPGKVCGRGCKKIRAQMCSSSTPCKNKMCRIWHDVEAHTDRCENPQCEFKNRILLRETMHKLEMKEQQIAAAKNELEGKQAEMKEVADDDKEELKNDIATLEHDLEDCNSELGVLEATKKTFWCNLNEIGIQESDDVVDHFPGFATHYEDKKTPRKARKAVPATTQLSSAPSRSSRAAARHGSTGPHGNNEEDEADDADGESAGDNISRRTARRSTSTGRQSAPSHHESDEETKGDDEETKREDDDHDLNDFPRADEPPLPPVGPPPFRQNPELDREYAVSASGYSIHPPADDLEAPAVASHVESTKEIEHSGANGLTEEQLADMQRASEEISGIMAGMSANPPPAEPLNTTGFTIRGNQPQNPDGSSTQLISLGEDDSKLEETASGLNESYLSKPVGPFGGIQGDLDDGVLSKDQPLQLQLEMLRGKLSRRNQVLEIIRRAYYRDVLIIKEELRQSGGKLGPMESMTLQRGEIPKLQRTQSRHVSTESGTIDGGLSSVPSVDLREVLPLFAPSETVLQVHPCESCGGHLELVHGESKELKAARQEMARAAKGEQQMRTMVHRMRSEAKQMEEVNEALQQRVKALMKENAYTLEQLQAARKMEREQKVIIAGMRSKLQLTQATQDEIDRLTSECKDVKQQLIRSNHDRDVFSASNNHLKEGLAEITKALHVVKVEKAQIEADFGTNYYRLQEEIKKTRQLSLDLSTRDEQLKDKIALCAEQQQSLTSLKEELVSTLQRFEQTKRHLEDQLIEEERVREEMQEQNLEFRRLNKKLVRDLENIQNHSMDMDSLSLLDDGEVSEKLDNTSFKKDRPRQQAANQAMRNNIRKKLDGLQWQLEWALMRENDLAGILARNTTGTSKMPGLKRILSRMPSKTVITRSPIPEGEIARPTPETTFVQETTHKLTKSETRSNGKTGDSIQGESKQADLSLKEEEDELLDAFEINEKNFEAYHKEVAGLLTEVKEGKEKITKQQKAIAELERKNQVVTDRLEESKLSIEALTGSVNALKMRLNQDSAGAAEMMEAMVRQIEEAKRDQQYEVERSVILMAFLRKVSESVHDISENKALVLDLELDVVPPDDPNDAVRDSEGGIQMMELQRKKREVRRKVLMEKAMKKFSIMCHNRAELIGVELQKVRASMERMRDDLDQAENKIDSDQLHIRTLDAEISKLRLTVDMGKKNFGKMERSLKQTTEELNDYATKCKMQGEEVKLLKGEHEKLGEDHKRLTLLLFEKTKAWQNEISTNDRCNQKIEKLEGDIGEIKKERQSLQTKLDEIEEQAEFRRRTNRSVEVSVIPETTDSEVQTDRWKPQGLILRQRNGPDRMPQRYLGKASVMIHCPEMSRASSPVIDLDTVPNQEVGSLSGFGDSISTKGTDTVEHMRGLLELNVYPSIKAGGRQIKTSYASARPKALSRLYLSSDGVSQKYIASTPHEGTQQRISFDGRPATVL